MSSPYDLRIPGRRRTIGDPRTAIPSVNGGGGLPPLRAAAPPATIGSRAAPATAQPPISRPQGGVGPPPTDLSDLGPLQKVGLALGDFSAGLQGRQGPSQQILAQRKQEYEAKRQQYLQGLQVLDVARQQLENTPVDKLEQRRKVLRDQFVQFAGGEEAGDLFDASLGDLGSSKAVLEQLAEDDAGKALLASGGTLKEINQLATSEGFLARKSERQDKANLPTVERKIKALLNSQDPEVRALLAKIQKDGFTTPEEIKQLNELGTQGPDGTKLTDSELQTLDRQQGALEERIPGFRRSEFFKTEQDLKQQEASAIRLAREKAKIEREEKLLAGPTQAEARDIDRLRAQYLSQSAKFLSYKEAAQGIEQASEDDSGASDIVLLYNFIKLQDPNAVKEGEIALTERASGPLQRYADLFNKVQSGSILDPKVREDLIKQARRSVTDRVATQLDLQDKFTKISLDQLPGVDPANVAIPLVPENLRGEAGGDRAAQAQARLADLEGGAPDAAAATDDEVLAPEDDPSIAVFEESALRKREEAEQAEKISKQKAGRPDAKAMQRAEGKVIALAKQVVGGGNPQAQAQLLEG